MIDTQGVELLQKMAWDQLHEICAEIPDKYRLTFEHATQLLGSGIDSASAQTAGIFSASAELAEQLTGHSKAGLIFTYFTPDGKDVYRWGPENKPFFRLRPDSPAGNAKYLSPKGAGVFVYYPRTTKVGDFKKIRTRLISTEGEKKSLSMCLHGHPCIGLGGVSSYQTGPKDSTSITARMGSLAQELDLFLVKEFLVVFDSDVSLKWEVGNAIRSFFRTLVDAYHERELEAMDSDGNVRPSKTISLARNKLKYTLLPNGLDDTKLGLDDAIVRLGLKSVERLLDAALPALSAEWKPESRNSKDMYLEIKSLFTSEPRGDDAPKKIFINAQDTLRSEMFCATAQRHNAMIPSLGYRRYNPETGVWEFIHDDDWATLIERFYDVQGWKNRGNTLDGLALKMLRNRAKVPSDKFDPEHYRAFTNGVLDLRSGDLLPHDPSYLLTNQFSYAFDYGARCDRWLQWLREVFGAHKNPDRAKELTRSLRAMLRWSLTPKRGQKNAVAVAAFIIGPPGNGKGSLMNLVNRLAGAEDARWIEDTFSDPNDLLGLLNAPAAICYDLGGDFSKKQLKCFNEVCDNAPVKVKSLYKNGIDTPLNTTLWAAMNRPIQSKAADRDGLYRRVLYFEFEPIAAEDRDYTVERQLLEELPGIYNWVMNLTEDEAMDIIKQAIPGSVNVDTHSKYLHESNTVLEWLNTLEASAKAMNEDDNIRTETIGVWHGIYRTWCSENGISNPFGPTNFAREVVSLGGTRWAKGTYRGPNCSHGSCHLTVPHPTRIDIRKALGF